MTRPAPIIAGTLAALLLLFGAYMGSYYALLAGSVVNCLEFRTDAEYWVNSAAAEAVFWPANQLDRWLLRRAYWGNVPVPIEQNPFDEWKGFGLQPAAESSSKESDAADLYGE